MKSPARHSRKRRPKPKAQSRPGTRVSTLRFLVTLALVAWAIRSLVIAPFSIPSGSMLPTLYIGDYLMVAKWPYGYSRFSFPFQFPPISGRILGHAPDRGDVVVFRHPSNDTDLIKRVVGLPGDTVDVRDGGLILNGKPVSRERPRRYLLPISANTPCKTAPPALPSIAQVEDRPYCLFSSYRETLPGGPSYSVIDQLDGGVADSYGPAKVPAGHVFLLGDNRDDSLDGRFSLAAGGIDMVPIDNLIGRAMVTFWSTDGSASYVNPWTWFTALRLDRLGNGYSGEAE